MGFVGAGRMDGWGSRNYIREMLFWNYIPAERMRSYNVIRSCNHCCFLIILFIAGNLFSSGVTRSSNI